MRTRVSDGQGEQLDLASVNLAAVQEMPQILLPVLRSLVLLLVLSILSAFMAFQVRLPQRIDVSSPSADSIAGFSTRIERGDGHSRRWSGRYAAVTFRDFGYEGAIDITVVAYAWRDPTQIYTATVTVNGYPIGMIDRANWRTWRFSVSDPALLSRDDLVVGFHVPVLLPTEEDGIEKGIGVESVEIKPLAPVPTLPEQWLTLVTFPAKRPLALVILFVALMYLAALSLGFAERRAFYAGAGLAAASAVTIAFFRIALEPRLSMLLILALALMILIAAVAPGRGTRESKAAGSEPPTTVGKRVRTPSAARRTLQRDPWTTLAIAYAVAFVVLGIATLPQYGLTWDEGLGHFFFGERYFHYLTSFDSAYLDFRDANLDIHQRPLNFSGSPWATPDMAAEFPPLADTLSAASMELLAYRLAWLDPVDALHLPVVLLGGLLLWALFVFARRRLGGFTALLAVLLLSTYPRFWGDMHLNPKDIPETVFFALVIIAFTYWQDKPSRLRALAVGLLTGCALSIKGNALFLPVVLIFGALPWQWSTRPWGPVVRHLRAYYDHYALMIASAAVLPFLLWPYVYADPARLFDYYGRLSTQGGRQGAGWNWDPLVQAVTTMPEVMLALLLLGLFFALRQMRSARGPTLRLLMVWAAIPILRASLPGMANFDGIRHFQEFLPAACLLAAFGGASLVELASESASRIQPARRQLWTTALVLLVVANLAHIYLRYSPYEYTYYNTLVGGLSGANRTYQFPEASDYWGGSYRNGMRWLNAHAAPNAGVFSNIAEWLVRLPAPLWLRSDLKVLSEPVANKWISDGNPLYVIFVTRPLYDNRLAEFCPSESTPVHEIVVDQLPILQIYRCQYQPTALQPK